MIYQYRFLFTILAFVLLVNQQAFSQQSVTITPSLSSDSAHVGDNIIYTLNTSRPKNVTILYPASQDSSFGKLEVRKLDKAVVKEENAIVTEKATYTLSAYDTGRVSIPDISIKYLDGSKESTLLVKGSSIYIKSILDTSKHVLDIKTVKMPSFPIWIIIAIIIGVIALAAIGYFTYKKITSKKDAPKEPELPSKTPYEVAIEAILKLQNEKLETQEDFKRYYTAISLILREFLENHYHILALEQITSEIYESLYYKLSSPDLEDLKKILDQSDLVKFAKFTPSTFDAKACFELSVKFIEKYKPLKQST